MDTTPSRWDRTYADTGRVWDDEPGALALFAVDDLRRRGIDAPTADLLDIGCGYGRDLGYLRVHLRGRLVGVDPSPAALSLARDRLRGTTDIGLVRGELQDLHLGRFGIVYTANVYHLLRPPQRAAFRAAVARHLAPGGLLYLSTMSVRDPQHHGRGTPVPGEPESFVDEAYLHFCTAAELRRDFHPLVTVERLREHEYLEPRVDGTEHHHVSWLMVGRRDEEAADRSIGGRVAGGRREEVAPA